MYRMKTDKKGRLAVVCFEVGPAIRIGRPALTFRFVLPILPIDVDFHLISLARHLVSETRLSVFPTRPRVLDTGSWVKRTEVPLKFTRLPVRWTQARVSRTRKEADFDLIFRLSRPNVWCF